MPKYYIYILMLVFPIAAAVNKSMTQIELAAQLHDKTLSCSCTAHCLLSFNHLNNSLNTLILLSVL